VAERRRHSLPTLEEGEVTSDPSLRQVAETIKRKPDQARAVEVHPLVVGLAHRWRRAEDLLAPGDEVSLTAWVIRKKAEWLLPRPEPAQASPSAPEVDPGWVSEAVRRLQAVWEEAARRHGRPCSLSLPRFPKLLGADVARLSQSWPVAPRRARSRPVVRLRLGQAPEERLTALRRRLEELGSFRFPWPGLGGRDEVVAWFVALLALWAGGEVELSQGEPWQPLEVRRVDRRRS
jgi:chromatin segregation and condensation protein Rec8/ScpA/Scc1 (kleisin family)